MDANEGERLQKVLAAAGIGSRRHCEELIAAGRVSVDGRPVTRPGTRVDPAQAVVRVDDERIRINLSLVHLAMNKPRGVVSSMADDQGRPDLSSLAGGRGGRLFHVGRLDADSEGLLLLTNEGELAHRLTHPSFEVPRTYLAEVRGSPTRDALRELRHGMELEDGWVQMDKVRLHASAGGHSLVEVTLHEGRNRLVRRTLEAAGYPVNRLVRQSFGPVHLGSLRPGRTRPLSSAELAALYKLVRI